MFRKLSLALAVAAALSPAGVFALGLGDITTDSALNERFDAKIGLLSVDPTEIDTVKVNLASAVDFAKAGLDRPYLLTRLRFEPVVLDDGDTVIRVSTEDAVREPFLNFLVEVNWPKGRIIREFTVLLDPPVTLDRRPPAIAAAEAAPVSRVARGEQTVPAEPSAPPMVMTGEYGPVRPGATLWRVAQDLDIGDASREQVMMALFRGNPQAFVGDDINMLKAGVMLQVPSREDILGIDRTYAREDFLAESRGLKTPEQRRNDREQDRLRIATARREEPPADEEAAPSAPPREDIEQVRSDLLIVKETSESTRQETDDLRSRIRELESQLSDIRQLLKLRNDQLAQMQAAQAAEFAEPEPGMEAEQVEPPLEIPQLPGGADEAFVEESADTVEPPVVSDLPDAREPTVGETPAGADQSAQMPRAQEPIPVEPEAPVLEETPARTATEPQPMSAVAGTPERQPGLLEQIMANSTLLAIGGAVVVVLLSLLWLMLRRRHEEESEFQESSLMTAGADGSTLELSEDVSEASRSLDGGQEETSFISDFSPSDIDALQDETGEVDPAAEADVYIAYGRYQQAESLINQAIEKSPDRMDLQAKLLEIYFTTRNSASFTQKAEQMAAAGAPQQNPALWDRVRAMGQELVPGHALFGIAEAEAGSSEAAFSSESESLSDLELDLDAGLSESSEGTSAPAGKGDELADGAVLDFPAELEPEGTVAMERKPAEDTVRMKRPEPKAESEPVPEDSEFSFDLGDLDALDDIDLGDLGEESIPAPEQPGDFEEDTSPFSRIQEEEEVAPISLDELDLGDVGSELDEGLSDLMPEAPGGEEVETKLDLARAYLEMGDGEGAREILDEVLKEGNDQQKTAARDLIEQIG